MAKNLVEIIVTAEDKASGVLEDIGGSLRGVGTIATGAAVAGIGALGGAFGAAAIEGIAMNASLEQSTMQFTTLMGDADKAAEHVGALFDFAAKTPFETGPIIEASKQLQVFGGEALNSMENLTLIGDASAAVGQPINDVSFWVGRLYSSLMAGKPFGEAAARLQEMGIMGPEARATLEGMQEAGASGTEIFAAFQGQLGSFTGAMEMQSQSWTGLTSTIRDQLSMTAAQVMKPFFDLAKQGLAALSEWLNSPAVQTGIQNIVTGLTTLATAFVSFITNQVVPFVTQHGEALKNIIAAIAVVLLASLVPAVVSIVTTMLPLIAIVAVVAAVIALLRAAWENNWGGIQEKVAAVWAVIQPLLQQVKDWLSIHVPIALEALRAFWVDVVWPAIQNAIAIVWPIIQTIFQALVTFVTGTLVPAIQTLFRVWTEEVWPVIQTVTENVWTIIKAIFEELGRWVNDNIVPWIQYLYKVWVEEVWPIIGDAVRNAWNVIRPIWEALKEWMESTLPPIFRAFRDVFNNVMGAISAAIEPVKGVWEGFVSAVQGFWDWLTGKVFTFTIELPDLPDWAVPGSPLPIHTAWKAFAGDMNKIGSQLAGGFDAGMGGLGTTSTQPSAMQNSTRNVTINIDARGASRGVDTDLRRMIEDVMREQGLRADTRMRTGY